MAFHAWGTGTPLAVDIFVILSSFLLTSSFLRRFEAGSIPNLVERWMHFFKRLIPPVVAVVGATLVLAVVFLPSNYWPDLAKQGWASVLCYQNWLLSAQSVDYFAAQKDGASPLMHLWYVGIQGQVYLLVPAILTAVFVLTSKRRSWARPAVALVFSAIALVLFVWTVRAIAAEGTSVVYFDTRSRAWEFALGCVIAAVRPLAARLPAALASLAQWAGLGALCYLGVIRYDNYPGPLALVTVAGAGALMLWGDRGSSWAPAGLLRLAPLQWLANRSYGIYLVHWPILDVYMLRTGRSELGVLEGLVLLVIAVALAGLLTELIDDPVHYAPWANATVWRKTAVVATSLAVAVAGLSIFSTKIERLQAQAPHASSEPTNYPGARALTEGYDRSIERPGALPRPISLDDQWVSLAEPCSGPFASPPEVDTEFHVSSCQQQPLLPRAHARAVIVGDSHAEQYSAGWIPVARERGWDLAASLMGGCPLTTPEASPYDDCADLNRQRREWLAALEPDIVILVVTKTQVGGPEIALPGVDEIVETLTRSGAVVLGLRDNPRFRSSPYDCTQRRQIGGGHLAGCAKAAREIYAHEMPDEQLRGLPGYFGIDTRPILCPDGACWSLIGNVFVYLDNNHLTEDFATTLAPFFLRAATEADVS